MVVDIQSEPAVDGRKQIMEYLLTSHPLDCPICDKGGECSLQDLAMAHGPGKSRFMVEDKMHLEKHVALGDLIFLDRERCIQCARCVRFQKEIVSDPVLAFAQRGRHLEIVTFSDPAFDSYFSGNTRFPVWRSTMGIEHCGFDLPPLPSWMQSLAQHETRSQLRGRGSGQTCNAPTE